MTERELVIRAKSGDDKAFEEIVKRYQQKVCTTIFYMIRNENCVEDLAQEVFFKVYRNLPKFQEESSLYTWIYRITMNTCLDQIKREKRVTYLPLTGTTFDGEEAEWEVEDEKQNMETMVEEKWRREQLIKAIKTLPSEQRALIVLRDIQQFKYMEIADMLQLNLGTVKSKISRARQMLKETLEKEGTFLDWEESNV